MATRSESAPQLPGLTCVETIGAGGYSNVYLYEQAITGMKVAVKVLSGEEISDEVRRRFVAEASAMARLADHPNIVQVFQADVTADGRPYFVMKYYPNPNLQDRVRHEQIPVQQVLSIGVKIACALATAHQVGILHRDVKPANILTSQYGEPGLADFGIATNLQDEDGGAEGMSIPWAPPEVIFATSEPDERSDVYSLAATLWHLLTGHAPYEEVGGDNSTLALMRRTREQTLSKIARPDVPIALERALAQALSKRPANRPVSALAFARTLQSVETEERWPPTPLVVLQDTEAPTNRSSSTSALADDEDRTQARAQRAQAQFAPPPPPAPVAAPETPRDEELDDPTSRRPAVVGGSMDRPVGPPSSRRSAVATSQENEPHTILRPRVVEPAAVVPEPEAETPATTETTGRRRRPSTALLVGGLIVVIVVVVAVVVASLGSSPNKNGAGASNGSHQSANNNANGAVGQNTTPGIPTVSGTIVGTNQAKFTWTYTNQAPGDTYDWEVAGGSGTWKPLSQPTVTVPVVQGQQTCILVKVANSLGQESPSPGTGCVS